MKKNTSKQMIKTKKVGSVPTFYRILDANFNRAKEGLRVCEDVCRYIWNDKGLTRGYKDVRHDLTQALEAVSILKIVEHRNVGGDVGTPTTFSEGKRTDLNAIFWANSQRVKESLRVLEEVLKIVNVSAAQSVKELRYKVYVLEQKAVRQR